MKQVFLVLVLALAAGYAAYRVTLRRGEEPPAGRGFGDEPSVDVPPSALYAYVPLAPGRRSWQTRVMGIAGIVIVIVLTSAILAFALYQAGHVVNKTFEGFTKDEGGAGSPTLVTPSP